MSALQCSQAPIVLLLQLRNAAVALSTSPRHLALLDFSVAAVTTPRPATWFALHAFVTAVYNIVNS